MSKLLSNPSRSVIQQGNYTVQQSDGTYTQPDRIVNNEAEEAAARMDGFTEEVAPPSAVPIVVEAPPAICPTCGQVIATKPVADMAAAVAPLVAAVREARLIPSESPSHAEDPVKAQGDYAAKREAREKANKALDDHLAEVEKQYGPASAEANEVRRLANIAHYVR